MGSEDTRFHNDKVRAHQASMGNNLAAINSFPKRGMSKRNRPSGPAIGEGNPVGDLVSKGSPTNTGIAPNVNLAPIQSPSPPPGFEPMYAASPSVNSEPEQSQISPELESLVQGIHSENLINSPDMLQAYTKVKLRDHFLDRHSGPDAGRQVLEILNSKLGG